MLRKCWVLLLLMSALGNVQAARQDTARQLNIPLTGSLQNPAFSPDNKTIIFTRWRDGYNVGAADLFIYNLETHTLQTLVSDNSANVNLPGASWNPTTRNITFSSTRGSHDEIYIISDAGEPINGIQITNRATKQSYEPAFSPDGEWLVFETHDIDVEQGVITKYKVDGSSAYIDLTNIADNAKQPNWSPSGNKLLYQQEEATGWAIWIMDDDGQNKARIIGPPTASATDAAFSSDGKWIIYSAENGDIARANIFKIPVGGGVPVRITTSDAYDGAVSLSSDRRKIAFESIDADPDGSAGTALWLLDNHDVNDDGRVNIADVIYIINCLAPQSYGVSLSQLQEINLWEIYFTEAPRLRLEQEKKYKTLTRASQR